MRMFAILVPVVGASIAAGLPLARYVEKQRHEAIAVTTLRLIHDGQQQHRATFGGYATDLATLATGCPGNVPPLPADILDDLAGAGYVLELRAATDATPAGQDCQGRPMATDYYVSASPRTAWEAAGKAFAGRADRELFVFVDGVPPRESDMTSGLPITVDELDSFKIP
jgi:hypothetical protein